MPSDNEKAFQFIGRSEIVRDHLLHVFKHEPSPRGPWQMCTVKKQLKWNNAGLEYVGICWNAMVMAWSVGVSGASWN